MYSVYLSFEGDSKRALERFRYKYDSLSGKLEAHITVLFPNDELALVDIISSVKKLQIQDRFDVHARNDITYDGAVGFLAIEMGAGDITQIQNHLSNDLRIKSLANYVPHITVVRDSAHRPSSIGSTSTKFTISSIVVAEILESGVGKVAYKQELR